MSGWTFAAGALVFMVVVGFYEALQTISYRRNRANHLCAKCGHQFKVDEQRITSWLWFSHMGKGEDYEFKYLQKVLAKGEVLLIFFGPLVEALLI